MSSIYPSNDECEVGAALQTLRATHIFNSVKALRCNSYARKYASDDLRPMCTRKTIEPGSTIGPINQVICPVVAFSRHVKSDLRQGIDKNESKGEIKKTERYPSQKKEEGNGNTFIHCTPIGNI